MKHLGYLSLGSNMGDKFVYISQTLKLIEKNVGEIILQSSIYESEPWGYNDSENYFNLVIKVTTNLEITDLLIHCQDIEIEIGRKRSKPSYEPRVIDIDILFFDDCNLQTSTLIIPHPRLTLRKFVLVPFCEIEPTFCHPILNKKIEELLADCLDKGKIKKILPPKI